VAYSTYFTLLIGLRPLVAGFLHGLLEGVYVKQRRNYFAVRNPKIKPEITETNNIKSTSIPIQKYRGPKDEDNQLYTIDKYQIRSHPLLRDGTVCWEQGGMGMHMGSQQWSATPIIRARGASLQSIDNVVVDRFRRRSLGSKKRQQVIQGDLSGAWCRATAAIAADLSPKPSSISTSPSVV